MCNVLTGCINSRTSNYRVRVNLYHRNLIKREEIFLNMDEHDVMLVLLESMFQRYKYCVSETLRTIKLYLRKISLKLKTSENIIIKALEVGLITDLDAKILREMLYFRKKASCPYEEETADLISKKIPDFYLLMRKVIDSLEEN